MKAIILSPISLVFCILLNLCCNSTKFSMMDEMIDTSENISMTLLKTDTIISKDYLIICVVTNKSNIDIALLNRPDITTNESPEFIWYAEIYFKETEKQKMLPFPLLGDFKMPDSSEYIILKPKEKKEFKFKIDFSKLENKSEVIPIEYNNTDYGVYSIKLVYKDAFLKHDKALRDQIESNTIEVVYKE